MPSPVFPTDEIGFESIFEANPDALLVVIDDAIVVANPAAVRLFGAASPADLVGRRSGDGIAAERLFRLDGTALDVDVIATPLSGGAARLIVLRDATARREAARRECEGCDTTAREASLRGLIDLLPMWVCARDEHGVLVLANRTLAEALGRSVAEVEGQTLVDLGLPRDVAACWTERDQAALAAGAMIRTEGEPFVTRDGGRTVDITRVPVALGDRTLVLCAAVDTTERRRLEAELVQTERLDAIGRLASSVAHELNNLLTVVMAAADMLAEAAGPAAQDDARAITHATTRAGVLTQNLLAFAHSVTGEQGRCELAGAVLAARPAIEAALGPSVRLELVVDVDGRVNLHPSEVERILVNLATNARDAMAAGGVFTVGVGVGPTGQAEIAVRDTGVAMDAVAQARVSEPFLSARATSGPSGLGLPTMVALVRRAGGRVGFVTDDGPGTGIVVHLPLDRAAEPPAAAARGPRLVLVVDDEPDVRRAMVRQIERFGHRVLTAGSADEAVAVWRAQPAPVELLVSDVVMPGRSGVELARELRALDPQLAVLLVSGYSPELLPEGEGMVFLAKPFSRGALGARISEALAQPR